MEMVGEYKNKDTKTVFRCESGHEWATTPGNVMGGSGCAACAGNKKLDADSVNKRVSERGYRLVGEYKNKDTKTEFSCGKGHQWFSTPGNIMRGNGCPHCSGNARHSAETVNAALVERQIKLTQGFTSVNHKADFSCAEGHFWRATPNNILSGKGCPTCATSATDNDAVYIWRSVGETFNGTPVYKVGITSARLDDKRINEVAKKSDRQAEIVIIKRVDNARSIETLLKTFGVDPMVAKCDGSTEFRAMTDEQLAQAVKLIQDQQHGKKA
jgi:hypothetical protein